MIAQNELFVFKGQVIDKNKAILSNVNIQLTNLNKVTKTNKNGFFEFKNIPLGSYQLYLYAKGYTPITTTIYVTKSNKTQTIILNKEEELEEIIITAELKNKAKVKGYEVSVIKISEENKTSKTINQILSQKASINVRQSGGLGSRVSFSLNGLSENSIRFFIDGIPMEYYGSSFSINTIPTSIIDKIEIYKGVTPIYLSNDNLGGAINLITKKATENLTELSYTFGSFNTHIASVYTNVENPENNTYLNAFGFFNHADNNYKVWGDKILITNPNTLEVTRGNTVKRFHDAFQSKGIKLSGGLKNKKWTNKFEVGFIYADLHKEIQHGTTMEIPFGEANYNQKSYNPYITFSKKNIFKKKLNIQTYLGYTNTVRRHIDTTKNIYSWNGDIIGQRTLGGEQYSTLTQNTLKKNAFLQKTGTNYKVSKNHEVFLTSQSAFIKRNENDPTIINPNEAYFTPQYFNKNSLALSVDSKWMNSRFKTSFFLKNHSFNSSIKTTEDGQTFTNTDADANLFGYGFSSAYKITQLFLLKGSFEQSNRLPEEEEILGNGINILSTNELKPEQAYNYNLGIEHTLNLNTKSTLSYEVNFFKRDVENLIRLWQTNDAVFSYINFSKIDITGFDLGIHYKWNEQFQINYSLSKLFPKIKSKYDEDGNINLLYNETLSNTLLLKSTVNSQISFKNIAKEKDVLNIRWSSNFTDSFFVLDTKFGANNKDAIPQQFSHNLGANYTFPNKKISIGIDVNNIFNEQLFDNFAIQKPGRNLNLKINYSII